MKRGCDLLIFENPDQKIAAFGSSYRSLLWRGDLSPFQCAALAGLVLQTNDRGTPTQVNAPPSALGVYSPRPFSRAHAGEPQWIQPYLKSG